ncbi:MAG: arsenate reductase (glutaredoxin) [Alphaproteobacteria bacterium]
MGAEAVIIYHNPRCGKSRATLELLRERGIEPQVVEYLKTPPGAKQLGEIIDKLGIEPRALLRKGEAAYKEAGLDDPKLSRTRLIAAMVEHPILIERPIVVKGNKARIGRPPEAVLAIL